MESNRVISLLNACYKISGNSFIEKLKAQAEQFILERQNGIQKASIHCLASKYLQKRQEFNMETHLEFLDYVKAFDNVKRDELF